MNNKEQKLMLICFPFNPSENLTIGHANNCMDCGLQVWVSKSSLDRIEANFPKVDFKINPLEIVCAKCANKRIEKEEEKGEEVIVVPPTDSQMEELRTLMNKNNPNVN